MLEIFVIGFQGMDMGRFSKAMRNGALPKKI
jgi:hypothetical protein